MNSALLPFVGITLYIALLFGTTAGIAIWRIRRRREKPPIEFKLRRGPGESLRREMAKFSDDLFFKCLVAAFAPLFVGGLTLQLLIWATPHLRFSYALAIVGGVTLAVAVALMGSLLKQLFRYRNNRLGYLGERAVGEALEPLIAAGYRVFHDVPAEVGEMKFNVDHVVVGPTGVFAVETKTRRKGRARPGFEAHKVAYDGKQLIWPWAEDSYGLKNAADRARWLADWLNRMTGLGVDVRPVLALPGWYVVPKGFGAVTVANHKQLFGAISRKTEQGLSGERIDLIARQLDALCRDVDD